MTCAVCLDDVAVDDALVLPGCGHVMHRACALTAAQYDTRCPVCRRVPDGVVRVSPSERNDVRTRAIDERVLYVTTLTWNDDDDDDDDGDLERAWRRYRTRRRRCLNREPLLRDAYKRLQELERTMQRETTMLEREFQRRCRELWRTDPDVRARVADLTRMRRRELRLHRVVHTELRERIGPAPSEGDGDEHAESAI